jgi:hypothetical protein
MSLKNPPSGAVKFCAGVEPSMGTRNRAITPVPCTNTSYTTSLLVGSIRASPGCSSPSSTAAPFPGLAVRKLASDVPVSGNQRTRSPLGLRMTSSSKVEVLNNAPDLAGPAAGTVKSAVRSASGLPAAMVCTTRVLSAVIANVRELASGASLGG